MALWLIPSAAMSHNYVSQTLKPFISCSKAFHNPNNYHGSLYWTISKTHICALDHEFSFFVLKAIVKKYFLSLLSPSLSESIQGSMFREPTKDFLVQM